MISCHDIILYYVYEANAWFETDLKNLLRSSSGKLWEGLGLDKFVEIRGQVVTMLGARRASWWLEARNRDARWASWWLEAPEWLQKLHPELILGAFQALLRSS